MIQSKISQLECDVLDNFVTYDNYWFSAKFYDIKPCLPDEV